MKRFTISPFPRTLGIFVMLVAWFAVSNHCALASLRAGTAATEAPEIAEQCCSSKAQDKQDAPKAPGEVCCKSLRVVPSETGAKLIKLHDAPLLFELAWTALFDSIFARELPPAEPQATDPPIAQTFAELVLQRSLLSHAPPFLRLT